MMPMSADTVSVPTPNMHVCKKEKLESPRTMVNRHASSMDKEPANNPAIDPHRKVTAITAAKKVANGKPVASRRRNQGAKITRNAAATATTAVATKYARKECCGKRGRSKDRKFIVTSHRRGAT